MRPTILQSLTATFLGLQVLMACSSDRDIESSSRMSSSTLSTELDGFGSALPYGKLEALDASLDKIELELAQHFTHELKTRTELANQLLVGNAGVNLQRYADSNKDKAEREFKLLVLSLDLLSRFEEKGVAVDSCKASNASVVLNVFAGDLRLRTGAFELSQDDVQAFCEAAIPNLKAHLGIKAFQKQVIDSLNRVSTFIVTSIGPQLCKIPDYRLPGVCPKVSATNLQRLSAYTKRYYAIETKKKILQAVPYAVIRSLSLDSSSSYSRFQVRKNLAMIQDAMQITAVYEQLFHPYMVYLKERLANLDRKIFNRDIALCQGNPSDMDHCEANLLNRELTEAQQALDRTSNSLFERDQAIEKNDSRARACLESDLLKSRGRYLDSVRSPLLQDQLTLVGQKIQNQIKVDSLAVEEAKARDQKTDIQKRLGDIEFAERKLDLENSGKDRRAALTESLEALKLDHEKFVIRQRDTEAQIASANEIIKELDPNNSLSGAAEIKSLYATLKNNAEQVKVQVAEANSYLGKIKTEKDPAVLKALLDSYCGTQPAGGNEIQAKACDSIKRWQVASDLAAALDTQSLEGIQSSRCQLDKSRLSAMEVEFCQFVDEAVGLAGFHKLMNDSDPANDCAVEPKFESGREYCRQKRDWDELQDLKAKLDTGSVSCAEDAIKSSTQRKYCILKKDRERLSRLSGADFVTAGNICDDATITGKTAELCQVARKYNALGRLSEELFKLRSFGLPCPYQSCLLGPDQAVAHLGLGSPAPASTFYRMGWDGARLFGYITNDGLNYRYLGLEGQWGGTWRDYTTPLTKPMTPINYTSILSECTISSLRGESPFAEACQVEKATRKLVTETIPSLNNLMWGIISSFEIIKGNPSVDDKYQIARPTEILILPTEFRNLCSADTGVPNLQQKIQNHCMSISAYNPAIGGYYKHTYGSMAAPGAWDSKMASLPPYFQFRDETMRFLGAPGIRWNAIEPPFFETAINGFSFTDPKQQPWPGVLRGLFDTRSEAVNWIRQGKNSVIDQLQSRISSDKLTMANSFTVAKKEAAEGLVAMDNQIAMLKQDLNDQLNGGTKALEATKSGFAERVGKDIPERIAISRAGFFDRATMARSELEIFVVSSGNSSVESFTNYAVQLASFISNNKQALAAKQDQLIALQGAKEEIEKNQVANRQARARVQQQIGELDSYLTRKESIYAQQYGELKADQVLSKSISQIELKKAAITLSTSSLESSLFENTRKRELAELEEEKRTNQMQFEYWDMMCSRKLDIGFEPEQLDQYAAEGLKEARSHILASLDLMDHAASIVLNDPEAFRQEMAEVRKKVEAVYSGYSTTSEMTSSNKEGNRARLQNLTYTIFPILQARARDIQAEIKTKGLWQIRTVTIPLMPQYVPVDIGGEGEDAIVQYYRRLESGARIDETSDAYQACLDRGYSRAYCVSVFGASGGKVLNLDRNALTQCFTSVLGDQIKAIDDILVCPGSSSEGCEASAFNLDRDRIPVPLGTDILNPQGGMRRWYGSRYRFAREFKSEFKDQISAIQQVWEAHKFFNLFTSHMDTVNQLNALGGDLNQSVRADSILRVGPDLAGVEEDSLVVGIKLRAFGSGTAATTQSIPINVGMDGVSVVPGGHDGGFGLTENNENRPQNKLFSVGPKGLFEQPYLNDWQTVIARENATALNRDERSRDAGPMIGLSGVLPQLRLKMDKRRRVQGNSPYVAGFLLDLDLAVFNRRVEPKWYVKSEQSDDGYAYPLNKYGDELLSNVSSSAAYQAFGGSSPLEWLFDKGSRNSSCRKAMRDLNE